MLAVILLCFGLVYLGLPTYDYYFDGLTFAMAVEGVAAGGDPAWLFHPHHLLYTPAAFGFYKFVSALGLQVRALLVMQIMSAGLALGALAYFYRLVRGLGFVPSAAAAGTVLLGSSYTFWRFGTQGDTTMPVVFLLLSLVYCCSRLRYRSVSPTNAAAIGALLGAATLIHQTGALFAPAAAYAVWRASAPKRRMVNAAAFFGAAGALCLAAYLSIAFSLGSGGLSGAKDWALGYFADDPRTGYRVVYGSWEISDLAASARAWAAGFVGVWPGPAGAASMAWHAGAAAFLAAILFLAGRGTWRALLAPARRADNPADRLAAALIIWTASHAAFFTWWKAGHVRFWLLALPAWLLLALYGLRSGKRPGRTSRRAWPALWTLAAASLLLVGSGPFRHESNPGNNEFLAAAAKIEAAAATEGTVIISGTGRYAALKAYVPYFAQRKMLVLDWQFSDKRVPPERALNALARKLAAMARAGPVYLLSETMDPEIDAHFLVWHGIPGDRRRTFLAGLNPRPFAEIAPGLSLLKL